MAQTTNAPSARPSSSQRFTHAARLGRRLVWHPEAYRILRCLARHPDAIATVGAAYRPDPALGNSAPWWNRHAINYFGAHVNRGDRVFEWGSGGSTAWLLSKGAAVISIEDDMEWVDNARTLSPGADLRAIPGKGTGSVKETFLEGRPDERDRRFFDDYVAAIDEFPADSFDVVVVDGVCRVECFQRALAKVRPGGLIVVDDTDMKPYRSLRKLVPGWTVRSFAGFKATKDLRETTFFHRPR
jgi:hypothetical protein